MKTTMKLFILFLLSCCIVTPMHAQNKKNEKVTVILSVAMDCQSCVKKIEKNIPFEKGVTDMKVDFEKQEVMLEYNSSKTDLKKLITAFEKLKVVAKEKK